MIFLKNKNRGKPNPVPGVQTIHCANKQHPFKDIKSYNPYQKTELKLYCSLREAVPVIDAAINKIIKLVGGFGIACDDPNLEQELNNFLNTLKVNSSMTGAESLIAAYLDELLTYGTAVAEIVPKASGNGVFAVYQANLENIVLTQGNSPLELKVLVKKGGKDNAYQTAPYPELLLITALNPKPTKIYGTSILKGLPFVSGILLGIYNSIGLNWERFGNLRYSVTYKPSTEAGEQALAKDRAMQIAKEWQKTMNSNYGVSDFVTVGDVSIKVIGADNQILDSNIPVRQMLEQIVAKLGIPPFLLGLNWSSTERMSSQQADILTSELEYYRRLLTPVIIKICKTHLMLKGIDGGFDVVWQNINLQDETELAQVRLLNAQAQEIEQRLLKEN